MDYSNAKRWDNAHERFYPLDFVMMYYTTTRERLVNARIAKEAALTELTEAKKKRKLNNHNMGSSSIHL